MKKALCVLLSFLFCHYCYGQQKQISSNSIPLVIGEQIVHKSEILNENRILNIYLPISYHKDSSKKYPIIYLLDGSLSEDFIHVAGVFQFGSFPWTNMVEESIIVGIANIDRKRDFTFPTENNAHKVKFPSSGHSKKFIQFIEKELQPLIDSNYRTNTTNTLIGQSLGGLLATEIFINNPHLFDNYIIVSPSLWWNDSSLLKAKLKPLKSTKTICIISGKEGQYMKKNAKTLYKKLNRESNSFGHLHFSYMRKYNHANILHQAVYSALTYIKSKPTNDISF